MKKQIEKYIKIHRIDMAEISENNKTKKCTFCLQIKNINLFSDKCNKCKQCRNERAKYLRKIKKENEDTLIKKENEGTILGNEDKTKKCTNCLQTKTLTSFGKNGSQCKQCKNERAKQLRKIKKEQQDKQEKPIDLTIWKLIPIENNKNKYYCTIDAKIYDRKQQKYMVLNYKRAKKNNDYVKTTLCKNRYHLHQIICLTWIGPKPSPEHTVDHIDRDKYNNHASNLRWATKKEQRANQNPSTRIKSQIITIDKENNQIIYKNIEEAAKHFSVPTKCITHYIYSSKSNIRSRGLLWKREINQSEIEGEIWKPIVKKGLKKGYQVSNHGRVKNNKIIMNQYLNKNYYYITFSNRKKYLVHRLIAEAFIDNPKNKPNVDHIDGNKLNNHLSNLRWVTAQENTKHRPNGVSKPEKTKFIVQYDLNGNEIKRFNTSKEAAKSLNKESGSSNIRKCCRENDKIAYGFRWKYIDKNQQSNDN